MAQSLAVNRRTRAGLAAVEQRGQDLAFGPGLRSAFLATSGRDA